MALELTFVNHYGDSAPKRRRLAKACESCRARKPLIDIYFSKVHPILPLLDEIEFRAQHASGVVPDALVHAVCLVAAKHSEAAPHLRLDDSQPPMLARDFCRRLHKTVMAALRFPGRYEKITLIRILALTSLHAETAEGAEEATLCLVQAMHYLQTMGWHLGQHTGPPSNDDLMTKRLFWCLWCMDRINSCIYGRPIMMSDIDIAIEPFENGDSGFPAFEVWVSITRILNKVISFYRPGVPLDLTGWEDDFPPFEDALDESKAHNLDRPTMTTLHLYYLLVAVLSHRSRGVKYVRRSTPSYVRQSLAAIEINRLMSSHLLQALLPLPILSYAISLAMSVSYQHLRQSQLQHQQEDARQDFKSCCQILQKLRRTWSAADVIATIAKKVLDQLEKAPDLASTEPDWHGLFEGMDDIFGTYLDPNYPVNLDDFSFVDDLSPLDNIPST
ncbi:hypothetical protein CERZMDRAFT_114966 [Cercospora zeae-maydis SCOH1-5]|uniref:Xylanolytic transcriptional activator regulatory domain-containing protein n=1 Tax=Cercospora zeae-maydis SCOH1-5 TaxID=717836 RepID=A0A6A6F2V8_9PEZI|nr:hypothetical protein CERZMDRAFT_114966 [Cercospora zeae-maydis SCOH1-5]